MLWLLRPVLAAIAALLFAGCASIVGVPTQDLPVSSDPSGATVSIVDEEGLAVFKGRTPTTVTLQKSTGNYWGGKSYKVRIELEGHEPQVVDVVARPNGWYLFGNIAFGGALGHFVIDPFTGKMYKLVPESVAATLVKPAKTGSIGKQGQVVTVVLLSDVPQAARANLVPIN